MADSTTPKPLVLPGSTSEEAIDLVSVVVEVREAIKGEQAATAIVEEGKEEDEDEGITTTQESGPLESSSGMESDVGIREDDTEKEAGVELAGSDTDGEYESSSAQVQPEAAQDDAEEQDVTSSSPPSASDPKPSSSAAAFPDSTSSSTPTPLLEVADSAELETPPGLDPPTMSVTVTLLKPSSKSATACEEEPLPLETVLPSPSALSSPTAFSSIPSSHQDSYEPSDPEPKAGLEFQQGQPEEYDVQQQPGLFHGQPQYQHDPFHHHQSQSQPPSRAFEPLPPSQLLSATISHALSLTPPAQPQFQFRSHPQQQQQSGPHFNFSYKPSSRDVISGIAPHVFDERRKRRSTSKGRRSSGRWYGYDNGYGSGSGHRGRTRGSPLRRSVVITWDERSIYLEEATQAGTVTSRISIDIATGHQRRDLSDSSCSSSLSGESSCSPTSSSASSVASSEKSSKKSLMGSVKSSGPRWSRKFKLFKNIVSRMKSSRDTPAQAVSAH